MGRLWLTSAGVVVLRNCGIKYFSRLKFLLGNLAFISLRKLIYNAILYYYAAGVQYIHVYYGTGSNWRYLSDEMLQEALDKDSTEILMIPRSFYWLPSGVDYGKCTYAPVVGQTDVGFAKFYSILYYMVSCICTYM